MPTTLLHDLHVTIPETYCGTLHGMNQFSITNLVVAFVFALRQKDWKRRLRWPKPEPHLITYPACSSKLTLAIYKDKKKQVYVFYSTAKLIKCKYSEKILSAQKKVL